MTLTMDFRHWRRIWTTWSCKKTVMKKASNNVIMSRQSIDQTLLNKVLRFFFPPLFSILLCLVVNILIQLECRVWCIVVRKFATAPWSFFSLYLFTYLFFDMLECSDLLVSNSYETIAWQSLFRKNWTGTTIYRNQTNPLLFFVFCFLLLKLHFFFF